MITKTNKNHLHRLKIAVIDHNRLFREGIITLLQPFEIIDSVQGIENGKDLLEIQEKELFDIILINCTLSDMSGADATSQILTTNPETKVICLSDKSDLDCVIKMITAGATGYVMKNSSIEELVNSIRVVNKGNSYFSKEVNLRLLASLRKKHNGHSHRISDLPLPITHREFEILKYISEELTNKEIADRLYISPRTVDTHRRNLLQKLTVKNTAGLVKYYLSIIKPNIAIL
jgi:DNA-binding NarL/FixJ family response regulator